MSEKLNELRKATMASYLAKAGKVIRADTSIAASFDNDVYKHMRVANDNHPNVINGKEKSPEKLAHAEKQMKVNAELRDTFKRSATNRIKGIALAGRRLAKEEAIVEAGKNPYGPGYKLIDKDGKQLHVGHKFKDEDGEHHEITGWQSGAQRGNSSSSGRVAVKVGKGKKAYHSEYFPHVFDMKVVKEEALDEAPLSPEHKDAIKSLSKIPSNYSHRDLETLRAHAANILRGANDAEWSARTAKNLRVQKKNKKRTVKETGSSIKNQEGHILHMKKRSVNSFDYTAHVGRGGKEVDAGSWSAIKYKHKIGGYNKHFKAAMKEEALDEVSRSTIAKVATARYNQAQAALKAKDFGGYVKKMGKAIKASDATTPKTGWSPEDDKKEEVVISPQEKYRQIKEAKARKALRGAGPQGPDSDKPKMKDSHEYTGKKKRPTMGDLPADVKLHGD
jgi:hypothetical protein